MKKLSWLLFVASLIMLLSLSACNSTPENTPAAIEDTGITVEDALGRTVSFERPPERIVISGRANFMLNDAVYLFPQAAERVVALTTLKQGGEFIHLIEPDAEQKTTLPIDVSADEIAAINPDLVLLKSFMADKIGSSLEELGIPVVYLGLETPEQYVNDIALLGKLLDDEARAAELNAFYQTRLEQIEAQVGEVTEKPEVLVVRYDTRSEEVALKVPPMEWIQSWMTEFAGGEPVWAEAASSSWTVVNMEQIAVWDPELVFVISYFSDVEEAVAKIKADPVWQALTAVKANKVYAFPQDFYSWDQPDTRWLLGVTWLAKRIQPELSTEITIEKTMQEFYALYGLDESQFNAEVMPRLKGDLE